MAAEPILHNAFWLGLQAKSTSRRIQAIPGEVSEVIGAIRGFGASTMAFAASSPWAAAAVGAVIGGSVVAGIVAYEFNKEQEFKKWEQRQRDYAKQQGLEP